MIYTVTLNPSLDYTIDVSNFKTGQINIVDTSVLLPGGKGNNVAQVLSRLGCKVTALGFIAGPTGDLLEDYLEEMGCRTNFSRIKNGFTRINVKMKSRNETEINGKGPSISKQDYYHFLDKIGKIKNGDVLVLSGSIPKGLNKNVYGQIIAVLKDKKVRVIVDARKELMLPTLKYHPFLVKPNVIELGEIFDIKIRTKQQLLDCARNLQKRGAQNILVSRAKDGAMFLQKGKMPIWVKAPKGNLKNSVGAGDSMVAGFIASLEESDDMLMALRTSIAAGSASAFSKELATKREVLELRKEIDL